MVFTVIESRCLLAIPGIVASVTTGRGACFGRLSAAPAKLRKARITPRGVCCATRLSVTRRGKVRGFSQPSSGTRADPRRDLRPFRLC
jgi:hypothetical protein